jgi:pyruvate kinase
MTKIICTIGPSSDEPQMLQCKWGHGLSGRERAPEPDLLPWISALADEGMKISRLNFSHAVKYEEMTEKVKRIRVGVPMSTPPQTRPREMT